MHNWRREVKEKGNTKPIREQKHTHTKLLHIQHTTELQ
jgi:hypothetical protein